MASKPTTLPTWATGSYPAGSNAWSGQPARVDPGSANYATGFLPNVKGLPEHVNWHLGNLWDWINYFDTNRGFFGMAVDADPNVVGTVATTNGSTTITGTGTQFNTFPWAGSQIVINGTAFTVSSVASATQLTVSVAPTFTGTGYGYAFQSVRNQHFVNLTIGAGNAYVPNQFTWSVQGTVTLGGMISANGNNGVFLTGGAASPTGTLKGGAAGGAATVATSGNPGGNTTNSFGGVGGAAGYGTGSGGGTASPTYNNYANGYIADFNTLMTGHFIGNGTLLPIQGGAGGGGGGSSTGGGNGGAGGGGGGFLLGRSHYVQVQTTTMAGTVSTTNGSQAVVGTGTNFLAIVPDTVITVGGNNLIVFSATDNTHITVATPATFTGSAFTWAITGALTALGGHGAGCTTTSGVTAGSGGGGGGGSIIHVVGGKSAAITYWRNGGYSQPGSGAGTNILGSPGNPGNSQEYAL